MEPENLKRQGPCGARIFRLREQGISYEGITQMINAEMKKKDPTWVPKDIYWIRKECDRIRANLKKCSMDEYLAFLGGDGVLRRYFANEKGIRSKEELLEWLADVKNIDTLDPRSHGCLSMLKII